MSTALRTYWLSFHAPYACRHAGACCTAGWPIPLERPQERTIRLAIAEGKLDAPRPWLTSVEHCPPEIAGLVATDPAGDCVFHRGDRCAIHRALGPAALPSACRHFPRVCLIDARGVFVTLSHYCPTAASLLLADARPSDIVEGPAALPDAAIPEGLDAREALPPLLAPALLMDLASYSAWERHMVRTLTSGADPDAAIGWLEQDAARLASWRPTRGRLVDEVMALGTGRRDDAFPGIDWTRDLGLADRARRAVRSPYQWPAAPEHTPHHWNHWAAAGWPSLAPVVGRYLAAHAFGSWTAYQGDGLHTLTGWLRITLAVLRVEIVRLCQEKSVSLGVDRMSRAIRTADLLLVHLMDRRGSPIDGS